MGGYIFRTSYAHMMSHVIKGKAINARSGDTRQLTLSFNTRAIALNLLICPLSRSVLFSDCSPRCYQSQPLHPMAKTLADLLKAINCINAMCTINAVAVMLVL